MNKICVTSRPSVRRGIRLPTLLATTVLAGLAHAGAVSAQSVEAEPERVSQLEEIVVTAQKRSENLQTVPITINAVTAEQMTAQGITDSVSFASAVPGLVMALNPAGPQIYLRGVGTKATTPGSEGATAVYVDGVYMASVPGAVFEFNNIERVEVLKGPQGTLFGRNATGGAISIITPDPSFTPRLDAQIGFGNYETIDGQFYASTALSDNVAIDLSASANRQSEGWGVNLFNGEAVGLADGYYLRSKLIWNIGPNTTLRVSLDKSDAFSSQTGATRQAPEGNTTNNYGAVYTGKYHNINVDGQPGSDTSQYGGSIKLNHEFSFAEFVSITAGRSLNSIYHYDQDNSTTSFLYATYPYVDRNFSQEFQLQSLADSDIKWILGLYYMDASSSQNPLVFEGNSQAASGGRLEKYATLETQSLAAFAQITYPLTDRMNVTGGLRYTNDEKSIVAYDVTALGVTPPASIVDKSVEFGELTYRFAVDYRFTDAIMGYASLNRGYKAGEYAAATPTRPHVEPEIIDAVEVGLKSQFWDSRARLNVAAFKYEYENIQLSRNVSGIGNILYNAAAAELMGVDVDFTLVATDNLTLRANVSYLDTEYTSYPDAPITVVCNGIDLALGCTAAQAGGKLGTHFGDASGNRMLLAPELTYNLSAAYGWDTTFGGFDASLSYSYNSGVYWDSDNRVKQDAYDLVSASLKWTSPDGRYDVRLWGANLGDTEYAQTLSYSSGDQYSAAPPRTFGIRLGYHY